MQKRRRATIKDIARKAGVSPPTVSRVLSNADYPVSKEAREKVLKAAAQLEYKPNIFGQILRGHTSKEIGIVVPGITNPFYAELVSTVAQKCVNKGYAPIVCCSFNSAELEKKQLEILHRQQVIGIILSSLMNWEEYKTTFDYENSPPMVLFDQVYEDYIGSSVYFDFVKSARMATQYLIDTGHKRIAFASTPLDRSSRRMIHQAYKDTLTENDFYYNKDLVFIRDNLLPLSEDSLEDDFLSGKVIAKQIVAGSKMPDAIICVNDVVAIGIMKEIQLHNIQIPRDISIIGLDDIHFAKMVTPGLTTVRQSAKETGLAAANILFRQLDNPQSVEEKAVIKPKLIIRKSVKDRTI